MIRAFLFLLLVGLSPLASAQPFVGTCTGSNVAAYQGYNCAPDNVQGWHDATQPLPAGTWYVVCPAGNCSSTRYGYYEQWSADIVGQTRKVMICATAPCPTDWAQMQYWFSDLTIPGVPAPPPDPPATWDMPTNQLLHVIALTFFFFFGFRQSFSG